VWKARDTRLDRIVAIKISKEKFTERFEREARSIAALNHPHICTLYDVGPDYLVMEYIEGQPLKGPVPADEAIRAGIEIAEALEHAHANGVVHRDLKPGNILATKAGVKVLDFGLAKPTAPEADVTLTVAGGVMGTPLYMAPEQHLGKPADARTDIYALGLILHELLTGRLPDGQPELAACGALAPVVKICLAKDPDDRWQSARDVRHALEMVAQAPVTPKTAGGFWKWIAAAGVVALLMAGFAFWPRPAPEESENRQFEIDPPPGGQFVDGSEISPDGRQVALMVEEGGVVSIWMCPLNALESRKLPGTGAPRILLVARQRWRSSLEALPEAV
jgi:serine/threonine protein kinase